MREKWVNEVTVEGYIFDHTLEKRTAGPNAKNPGQEFISGNIDVATDDEGINVVPVAFQYVVPTFKSGSENRTYGVLDKIINNCVKMSELPDGEKTGATKVSISASIDVNDFLGRDGTMVAVQRVRGSFCNQISSFKKMGATFRADMLIMATNEREIEGQDTFLELRGFCFNFRGDLLPVTFNVRNAGGMEFFEKADISTDEPYLTNVHGVIECSTYTSETKEESAWGEDDVKISVRTVRSWDVLGSSVNPMPFDDESTITWDELKEAKTTRDEYVAQRQKEAEEYRASQEGTQNFSDVKPGSSTKKKSAGFRF